MITLSSAEVMTIFNSFYYDVEGEHEPMVKVVLEGFDNYFAPRTNEFIDRYKFRSCKLLYVETIASYIARLCNLAKTCNFGNEKENNLSDQQYGCHDDSLREKLFREETLTLQTARQIATAHEAARQNMNLFRGQQQTHDSATVNKVIKVKADKRVSPRQGSTEGGTCTWPGLGRFVPGQAKCKFCGREHAFDRKQCHTYGRENHFAKMCRMQDKHERHKNTEPAERERQRPVYTVTVDDFSNQAEYDVLDVHCQI